MKSILKIYTRLVLFLLPLFFLPVMYNSFGLAKSGLLIIGGGIGLLLWLVEIIVKKNETVKWNGLLTWFLILAIWAGVEFFMMTPGVRNRSMMAPTGFGSIIGLLIWLFLWVQVEDEKERSFQFRWLSISGIIVAIGSLVAFMIPVSKLPLVWPKSNPILSISQGWSLTGSLVGEAILMLLLVINWLKGLLTKLKEKEDFSNYLTEAIGVVFFGLILFLDIYKMVKLGWGYLDTRTAWVIAVESLKNSPLFGTGVGNFYQAFLAFKPVSFNLTKYWASTFDTSSMGILNVWTEMGVLALAWVLLGVSKLLKKIKNNNFWMALVMALAVLFIPANLLVLVLFFWLLAFGNFWKTKEIKMKLLLSEKNVNVMPYLVGVLLLVGIGFGGYWETRILAADIYWMKAAKAAAKNDGANTYNNQIKAIGMNPNMADYRASYSQTCLALSQNFLNKKEISDTDKENGSTLIQQSVREAKAAISLDQSNSIYWSNLAGIYKSLIGLVDGAADWSIQAYQQAAILNQNDPMLKLNLGGLYFGLNDYESADRVFEEVVVSKNDYANGWYNWAYSGKQLGKLELAVNRMKKALELVPADSTDYETASKVLNEWQKELDELNKKKTEEAKKTSTEGEKTLTTPEALPSKTDEKKEIQSNEDMAPPVEVIPTVEISPTP